jgi:hypothetical protein
MPPPPPVSVADDHVKRLESGPPSVLTELDMESEVVELACDDEERSRAVVLRPPEP